MIKITVSRGAELQCSEANIVQSLVIDTERLVRVLYELVDGKGGVIRL